MVFKMGDYYCAICPLQGFLCPQLVDQLVASGVLGIIGLLCLSCTFTPFRVSFTPAG